MIKINRLSTRIMSTEESSGDKPANTAEGTGVHHTATRRLSKEYKFFRSFSAKVENWPMRKAEALWRRMRERKIAGTLDPSAKNIDNSLSPPSPPPRPFHPPPSTLHTPPPTILFSSRILIVHESILFSPSFFNFLFSFFPFPSFFL